MDLMHQMHAKAVALQMLFRLCGALAFRRHASAAFFDWAQKMENKHHRAGADQKVPNAGKAEKMTEKFQFEDITEKRKARCVCCKRVLRNCKRLETADDVCILFAGEERTGDRHAPRVARNDKKIHHRARETDRSKQPAPEVDGEKNSEKRVLQIGRAHV